MVPDQSHFSKTFIFILILVRIFQFQSLSFYEDVIFYQTKKQCSNCLGAIYNTSKLFAEISAYQFPSKIVKLRSKQIHHSN